MTACTLFIISTSYHDGATDSMSYNDRFFQCFHIGIPNRGHELSQPNLAQGRVCRGIDSTSNVSLHESTTKTIYDLPST